MMARRPAGPRSRRAVCSVWGRAFAPAAGKAEPQAKQHVKLRVQDMRKFLTNSTKSMEIRQFHEISPCLKGEARWPERVAVAPMSEIVFGAADEPHVGLMAMIAAGTCGQRGMVMQTPGVGGA